LCIFTHVANNLGVSWGQATGTGLISVEYTFSGDAAHSAGAPWRGKSAADATELMNIGWNYKREHLHPLKRSHSVITDGGDQPNVVPSKASIWYYFRDVNYNGIMEMYAQANDIAKGAALMTGTTMTSKVLGTAWPRHFNKVIAEKMYQNIQKVGLPAWDENDLALAKAVQRELGVPIGFIPCGIGATSVREWLPTGITFPNPPTILSRVRKTADGQWESDGKAYAMLVKRMGSVPAFRAVLWHQGESDANQKDATRTLPGKLYATYLTQLIQRAQQDSRRPASWFVAQVSYHGPTDVGSEDIRGAQASLWKAQVALEGPDSDALRGELRDGGGKGVHFSGEGLKAHAHAWAEKLIPWIAAQR
jgi:hypothetical protein